LFHIFYQSESYVAEPMVSEPLDPTMQGRIVPFDSLLVTSSVNLHKLVFQ